MFKTDTSRPYWLCRLIGHKWGTWTMDYDCCVLCGPEINGRFPFKKGTS